MRFPVEPGVGLSEKSKCRDDYFCNCVFRLSAELVGNFFHSFFFQASRAAMKHHFWTPRLNVRYLNFSAYWILYIDYSTLAGVGLSTCIQTKEHSVASPKSYV